MSGQRDSGAKNSEKTTGCGDQYEDKMRIYSVPNAGYKLSLFYRAAPVEIESTRSRRAARVMDVDFGLEEKQ